MVPPTRPGFSEILKYRAFPVQRPPCGPAVGRSPAAPRRAARWRGVASARLRSAVDRRLMCHETLCEVNQRMLACKKRDLILNAQSPRHHTSGPRPTQ